MPKKIIDSVKFDEKNFNMGTSFGKQLIDKSISKFGYREASVLDKHGNIIGGNKRTQSALDNGITEIEIIKAEKGKVYALQFDDIELDSEEGRELALALNATAKENISFDEVVIFETITDDVALDWGFDIPNSDSEIDLDKYFEEDVLGKEQKFKIFLEYNGEDYNKVVEAFSKLTGSKESIIYKFLEL